MFAPLLDASLSCFVEAAMDSAPSYKRIVCALQYSKNDGNRWQGGTFEDDLQK
jgi:hypothetical protein